MIYLIIQAQVTLLMSERRLEAADRNRANLTSYWKYLPGAGAWQIAKRLPEGGVYRLTAMPSWAKKISIPSPLGAQYCWQRASS